VLVDRLAELPVGAAADGHACWRDRHLAVLRPHQFDDVYWESGERWSYADAALRGSSYRKLPKVLQFFSGNIGLHHVHHLSARIPNYNLQRAHDENPIFDAVPILSLADGMRAVRLKLYDEQGHRMVTFAQASAHGRATPRPRLDDAVGTARTARQTST
jgi:fatty acid desaturase